jgi:sulfoxide reductase heme-binding subunit YedZ
MAHSAFLRAFGKHWMKPLTLAALIAPGAYLAFQWIMMLSNQPHAMGWDPVKWTHIYLGDTAIRVLLVTLAVSPVRDITGWAPIILIRRRIGLAAFFYAALHMLAYVGLDLGWSLAKLWEDITVRTYIMLGMAALLLMIPLALTSTNGMIRRLGRKVWERVHWLIYPLAILAVAHNILMQKTFQPTPIIHAAILAALLLWRVWKRGVAPRFARPVEA